MSCLGERVGCGPSSVTVLVVNIVTRGRGIKNDQNQHDVLVEWSITNIISRQQQANTGKQHAPIITDL